jgi:hypothetical protein
MMPWVRSGFGIHASAVCLALWVGSLLAMSPARGAEGNGDPQVAPIAKGQRVFTCGHSFHVFVYRLLDEIAKSAGIEDQQSVGLSAIGGSRVIQHWDVAEEDNKAQTALRAGEVDVLTLSPIWLPDEGIENFARLGLEHNPAIRVTVQEYWLPNDTYHPVYPLETRLGCDHNATSVDELRKQQSLYDHDLSDYICAINRRVGQDVLLLVPVVGW